MAILETDVDGVPTLIAPTSGPVRAALLFRVGQADETLVRSGVTHLVEHLALHRLGITDYHYNASVGTTVTIFHTVGDIDEVVAFLGQVCTQLRDLPTDRLQTEKDILRTEWAGKPRSVDETLARWRYGAQGYGLPGYRELGLRAVSEDDLQAWVEGWFARDNAVLTLTSDELPRGLQLNLPAGSRRPVPAPTCALPTMPAYFADGNGAVGFDAVVRRSPAVAAFTAVLQRQLYRVLRYEGGISYAVNTDQRPRGDWYSTVTAAADGLRDSQSAVLGGFIDTLAGSRPVG